MFRNSVRLGGGGQLAFFLLLAGSLLTANPACTFAALLFVLLAMKLLYRKNEPPILLTAMLLQWIQVTIKVFYADYYGFPLDRVVDHSLHVYEAYFGSLFALLSIAFGVWLMLARVETLTRDDYTEVVQSYSGKKIAVLYCFSVVAFPFILKLGQYSGGLQQFFFIFAEIKWTFLFIFFVVTQLKKEYRGAFYVILTAEVIFSFSGFFSSFKEYFILIGVAFLMLHQKLSLPQLARMAFFGFILMNFFIVWQVVKPEYRKYLNQGTKTQNVNVDPISALGTFGEMVGRVDSSQYKKGLELVIDRAGYLQYFSAAIAYVPEKQPHEWGKLWMGALTHVFMPRIFFPNKEAIDDSKLTNKYTGIEVYGADQGTSITLGYVGESYVDFGPQLMYVPLFLMGLFLGWIYRLFLKNTFHVIWGIGLLIPLVFHMNLFEAALIKLVGSLIAYYLVMLFIIKTKFINRIDRFLKAKHEANTHPDDLPEALSVGVQH